MHNEDIWVGLAATLKDLSGRLKHDVDMSDLGVFLVKLSDDSKTVTRKRGGVQYGENGRPMTVLFWRHHERVLAFKVPACTFSNRGYKDYISGSVIVCLVAGAEPDGWCPAWALCEWDHDRGRYADPKKPLDMFT